MMGRLMYGGAGAAIGSNLPLTQLFEYGIGAEGAGRMLHTIRKHLDMDVAFISHFTPPDRILEHVDSVPDGPLQKHQRIPLEEGYCLKVVQGELPEYIPDTSLVPATLNIPATHAIPIGSHLSVPVRLEDGQVYGTLCCFSFRPNPSLGERDMQLMRALAEVLAVHLDESEAIRRARQAQADEIRAAIAQGAPRIVFQPICHIEERRIRGFECLSRFDIEPRRSPGEWFDLAEQANLSLELELHAISKALPALRSLPQEYSLSVNSSPQLLLSGQMQPLFENLDDLSRIVIEVTEHAAVPDYDALSQALAPLRLRGARLAIDDAGAGYSSMRHILHLAPDIIKLDMSLTQHIDTDYKRRALAKGVTSFAHEIGSLVIAEGVEHHGELDMLRQIGVDCAQGYLLSKPIDLEAARVLTIPW